MAALAPEWSPCCRAGFVRVWDPNGSPPLCLQITEEKTEARGKSDVMNTHVVEPRLGPSGPLSRTCSLRLPLSWARLLAQRGLAESSWGRRAGPSVLCHSDMWSLFTLGVPSLVPLPGSTASGLVLPRWRFSFQAPFFPSHWECFGRVQLWVLSPPFLYWQVWEAGWTPSGLSLGLPNT